MSTPRPRGCSGVAHPGQAELEVDPAPAGMLLRLPFGSTPRAGRPRARGDAPPVVDSPVVAHRSTPRPRGCSSGVVLGSSVEEVDPAPAGMLRHTIYRTNTPERSTPRPRGCSGGVRGLGRPGRVDPAPAGMLRGNRGCTSPFPGRPRARGDAPADDMIGKISEGSISRPRGCSAPERPVLSHPDVDPAPAGMLLRFGGGPVRGGGRPRARGDAPSYTAKGWHAQMSTPRPRGCSEVTEHERGSAGVDPAPAGMLRVGTGSRSCSGGRPRARGDAPAAPMLRPFFPGSTLRPRGCSARTPKCRMAGSVDPAPAGMLRSTPAGRSTRSSRPSANTPQ